MSAELVEKLNANSRALTYDIIFNHSILSSLDANWENFYVDDNSTNSKSKFKYRRFRVNLHGLMAAVSAFCRNIAMRFHLLNAIPFDSYNMDENLKPSVSQMSVNQVQVSQKINDLFTEFIQINDHLKSIEENFVHSIQTENSLSDLTIFEINYNPKDSGPYIKSKSIPTTLNQYLESVVRLFHITLDLNERIAVFEKEYNIEAFDKLPVFFEGGLKNAQYELRQSARRIGREWEELHERLKELFY